MPDGSTVANPAARGCHGVAVDEIVAAARCNKRMLYHSFGDKEGLYVEVLRGRVTTQKTTAEAIGDMITLHAPIPAHGYRRDCVGHGCLGR
jgi:AcrR family transcriptional regulator